MGRKKSPEDPPNNSVITSHQRSFVDQLFGINPHPEPPSTPEPVDPWTTSTQYQFQVNADSLEITEVDIKAIKKEEQKRKKAEEHAQKAAAKEAEARRKAEEKAAKIQSGYVPPYQEIQNRNQIRRDNDDEVGDHAITTVDATRVKLVVNRHWVKRSRSGEPGKIWMWVRPQPKLEPPLSGKAIGLEKKLQAGDAAAWKAKLTERQQTIQTHQQQVNLQNLNIEDYHAPNLSSLPGTTEQGVNWNGWIKLWDAVGKALGKK